MWFAVEKGCIGVTLEDGRKFTAGPSGSFEVKDDDTIDAIKKCGNFLAGYIVEVKHFNLYDRDKEKIIKNYRVCDGCGRAPWDYQTVCSYCQSVLPALPV